MKLKQLFPQKTHHRTRHATIPQRPDGTNAIGIVTDHKTKRGRLRSRLQTRVLAALIFIAAAGGITTRSYAQDNATYTLMKSILIAQGYSICEEKYQNLAQGETSSFYRTFYASNSYRILAFSDDDNVTDVDVYLYYNPSGTLYIQDNDRSSLGAVSFSPAYNSSFEVKFKNYASNDPRYKSTVYVIVGYK